MSWTSIMQEVVRNKLTKADITRSFNNALGWREVQ